MQGAKPRACKFVGNAGHSCKGQRGSPFLILHCTPWRRRRPAKAARIGATTSAAADDGALSARGNKNEPESLRYCCDQREPKPIAKTIAA